VPGIPFRSRENNGINFPTLGFEPSISWFESGRLPGPGKGQL